MWYAAYLGSPFDICCIRIHHKSHNGWVHSRESEIRICPDYWPELGFNGHDLILAWLVWWHKYGWIETNEFCFPITLVRRALRRSFEELALWVPVSSRTTIYLLSVRGNQPNVFGRRQFILHLKWSHIVTNWICTLGLMRTQLLLQHPTALEIEHSVSKEIQSAVRRRGLLWNISTIETVLK